VNLPNCELNKLLVIRNSCQVVHYTNEKPTNKLCGLEKADSTLAPERIQGLKPRQSISIGSALNTVDALQMADCPSLAHESKGTHFGSTRLNSGLTY
jgi:hypothetical protein